MCVDSTEARILAAARAVFEEEGFRGATTRKIAERAGVNEVTLFRHFASKEALIGAALAEGHRIALERLAAARPPAVPQDAAAELGAYLGAVRRAFSGASRGVRTALAEWEHLPAYHPWLLGPSEAVMEELRRYLEAARSGGRVAADADLEAAVHLLTATVFANGLLAPLMPRQFGGDPAEVMRRCVGLVLGAIGAESARDGDATDDGKERTG